MGERDFGSSATVRIQGCVASLPAQNWERRNRGPGESVGSSPPNATPAANDPVRPAWLRPRPSMRLYAAARLPVLVFVSIFIFIFPPNLFPQTAEPDVTAVTRVLKDASRALQARNAARFLSYFDRKRSADYLEIESNVVALTRQADIASSIEVSDLTQEAGEYLATADWILQLTLISAPGQVTTRHENVHLRVAKSKGRWKIVELDPVDFLRPL